MNPEARVYVGSLDYRVTKGEVVRLLNRYGEIVDVYMPKQPERRELSLGYAFVEFRHSADANRCIEGSQDLIDPYDRKVIVKMADARKAQEPRKNS